MHDEYEQLNYLLNFCNKIRGYVAQKLIYTEFISNIYLLMWDVRLYTLLVAPCVPSWYGQEQLSLQFM
jgi:hypothetical protein